MRTFTIDDSVFKTNPMFVIGCSHVDLGRYLKKRFKVTVGDDIGQCGQMLTFTEPPWRVVWVERQGDVETLIHEVFHLVTRVCHDKGVPIRALTGDGENGDEAAAYLFEFLCGTALKRMRRWRT